MYILESLTPNLHRVDLPCFLRAEGRVVILLGGRKRIPRSYVDFPPVLLCLAPPMPQRCLVLLQSLGLFQVLNGFVHPNTDLCFHLLPSAKPFGTCPSAFQLPETVVDVFVFCRPLFSLSLRVSVTLNLQGYFRGVFLGDGKQR